MKRQWEATSVQTIDLGEEQMFILSDRSRAQTRVLFRGAWLGETRHRDGSRGAVRALRLLGSWPRTWMLALRTLSSRLGVKAVSARARDARRESERAYA